MLDKVKREFRVVYEIEQKPYVDAQLNIIVKGYSIQEAIGAASEILASTKPSAVIDCGTGEEVTEKDL